MSASGFNDPSQKYSPCISADLPGRTWPSRTISQAPLWCSVDLSDGSQALPIAMSLEEKLDLFHLLTKIGFKEIEIGSPGAEPSDYAFLRHLIDRRLIPADVALQVTSPCTESLIVKTFQAIAGAPRVIFHFSGNINPLPWEPADSGGQEAILAAARACAGQIHGLGREARQKGLKLTYAYSLESFTETEPAFALRIAEEVLDVLEAEAVEPVILGLPATVERCTPNHYADQIEWFCQNTRNRSRFILSVRPGNDRGSAVAAAELAMLAGAQRIEGSLFGNGPRAGNADLMTLSLNLYSQGINPGLDFSDINNLRQVYQKAAHLPVSPRHPYAGELVYTAFTGAQQEAILNALSQRKKRRLTGWQVPYLPLDPADVGRQYEPILRINSHSARASAGFILENLFGYKIPKAMLPELGQMIRERADRDDLEINGETLLSIFSEEFVRPQGPYELKSFRTAYLNEADEEDNEVHFSGIINYNGEAREAEGKGNGPIDALYDALKTLGAADYDFLSYDQHALSSGSDSRAVAYIRLRDKQGRSRFGAGTSRDIRKASLRALISAVNRMSRIQD